MSGQVCWCRGSGYPHVHAEPEETPPVCGHRWSTAHNGGHRCEIQGEHETHVCWCGAVPIETPHNPDYVEPTFAPESRGTCHCDRLGFPHLRATASGCPSYRLPATPPALDEQLREIGSRRPLVIPSPVESPAVTETEDLCAERGRIIEGLVDHIKRTAEIVHTDYHIEAGGRWVHCPHRTCDEARKAIWG